MYTHTNTHRNTQTHRCADTHRDTHTQTLTDTNTHTRARAHTLTHTLQSTQKLKQRLTCSPGLITSRKPGSLSSLGPAGPPPVSPAPSSGPGLPPQAGGWWPLQGQAEVVLQQETGKTQQLWPRWGPPPAPWSGPLLPSREAPRARSTTVMCRLGQGRAGGWTGR